MMPFNTFMHLTDTSALYSLFLILINIGLIFFWVIVNHIRQSIKTNQNVIAEETDTESNMEEDSSITLSSAPFCQEELY